MPMLTVPGLEGEGVSEGGVNMCAVVMGRTHEEIYLSIKLKQQTKRRNAFLCVCLKKIVQTWS